MSYWNHTKKDLPTNFIFGFGSIVNDESRHSTVENSGDPIPVRISPQFGYRRVWNFQPTSSKLTALGLEKVTDGKLTTINGIIYPLVGDQQSNTNPTTNQLTNQTTTNYQLPTNPITNQLTAFDKREEGYIRIEVPLNMIEVTSWQCLPKHQYKVWIYVPVGKIPGYEHKTPGENLYGPDKYCPILQSYVDIVMLGFLKYGNDYALEFLYTTSGWSRYWLNDRQVPRRPWLFQPKYRNIDTLLSEFSKKYGLMNQIGDRSNIYPLRKLPVEFSIYFAREINKENTENTENQDIVSSDGPNSICSNDEKCTDLCF